jgi:hypothetical protein
LFWLGVIEATRPELCPNFFHVDLAPAILGFLSCDDISSPLDHATLGSLRRDNTLPLAPPTLGFPRRGDTSSLLTPEIMGVLSDDTSPALIPEVPGVLGGRRDDTSTPLAPGILRAVRRDTPHPPPFPAYISHPLPTLSFPVPSILVNTHPATPATPARPVSPTVQLVGTTTNQQNIAPAMPDSVVLLPSMQRGPRPFARSWSYRAYTSVLYNIRVNNA